MDAPVSADRYTYGKVVETPGGAVVDGFEHQPTSVSPRLGTAVLEFCHPRGLLGQDATSLLVHESAHARGALFLWPVRGDGREAMILGRLRPRSEQGEGAPGRTYTQLNVAVVDGHDWRAQAPEIVALIPDWLRAEPDLKEDFRAGLAPPILIPIDPERPVCAMTDPLPVPTDPAWSMLQGLESPRRPTLLGADPALPDEAAFCRALARALALLPPPLRPLVSACAGFATAREEFAIQFIPQPPGQPAEPRAGGGYFAQEAGLRHCETFGDWVHQCHEELQRHLEQPGPDPDWHAPTQARDRAARILADLAQGQFIDALQAWLEGGLAACPALPAGPGTERTRQRVVLEVAGRIRQGLEGDQPSLTLVRACTLAVGLTGPDWTRAWDAAARAMRGYAVSEADRPETAAGLRDLLLCAALRSDPRDDDSAAGIGTIASFADLARLQRLEGLLARQDQAAGQPPTRRLRHPGLAVRLRDLLARAPRVLMRNPFDLIHLAATFPDAFAAGQGGAEAAAAIRQIIRAAGLIALHRKRGRQPYLDLYQAASLVMGASYGLTLPALEETAPRWREAAPDLRIPWFDHFLEASTGGAGGGPEFWQQAVLWACIEGAGTEGARGALTALLDLVKAHAGRQRQAIDFDRIGDGLKALLDGVFHQVARVEPDPARLVMAHLEALMTVDLNLAGEPGQNRLKAALARAWQRSLRVALRHTGAGGAATIAAGVAEVVKAIEQARTNFAVKDFAIDLGAETLQRMVAVGYTHRARSLDLLEPVERLLAAALREARPPLNAPKWVREQQQPRVDACERLVAALARTLRSLICAWADAPEPTPWLARLPPGQLGQYPARLYLARSVGFPRCLYLGRLAHWTRDGPDHHLVAADAGRPAAGRSPGAEPIADAPVPEASTLAICAIAIWREQYQSGVPEFRSQIGTLLGQDGADDALIGLTGIAAAGTPGSRAAVGADMLFLAEVLGCTPPPRHPAPTPAEIRAALFAPDIDGKAREGCLALYLARHCLRSTVAGLTICHPFLRHLEGPGGFADAVLGTGMAVRAATDEAMAARLDRVLFALDLLYCLPEDQPHAGPPPERRLGIGVRELRSFRLSEDQGERIRRLFRVDPACQEAFRRSLRPARITRLEGWPVS